MHRILCVDDDPDARALLEIALVTVGGFELRFCGSGDQALRTIESFEPDLMILDVKMPGRDGPQTLDELRHHAHGRDCPVVFLTAAAQPGALEPLDQAGATAVVTKPFDPMTLAQTLRKLVGQPDA